MSYIFNRSLSEGKFPDDWKSARVCPIFKSGKRDECANYRPISILSAISKIFEKLVFEQLSRYLTTNKILTDYQSGFRKGFSACFSLLRTTNEWLVNMDKGLINGVVFLDLKKAFDTVDHDILIKKLEFYGIKNNTLRWFISYYVHLVLRDTFCVSKSAAKVLNSFEYSEWKIISGSFRLLLVVIYRPPYSSNHPVTVNAFIEEFSQRMSTDPLLITGDFNIHVNSKSDNDVLKFLDLLQSMGLRQHVEFPTHVSGNTLDLVITREVDSLFGSKPQPDHCFSDHIAILFELTTSKPTPSKEYISYRPIKSVDISKFTADLAVSDLCLNTPMQLVIIIRYPIFWIVMLR